MVFFVISSISRDPTVFLHYMNDLPAYPTAHDNFENIV